MIVSKRKLYFDDLRVDALSIELIVKDGHRKDNTLTLARAMVRKAHLVVHRSPFGIDDHVFSCMLSTLLCLRNLLLSQLLDSPGAVDVRAVSARSKDCSDKGGSMLVRAGQQGADSLRSMQSSTAQTHIVDESAASDVDVFAVKRILEKSDNIMTNGVFGIETLRPSQELSSVDSRLLDREARMSSEYQRHIPEGESEVHGLVGVLDV
jgi:hypothetical protein